MNLSEMLTLEPLGDGRYRAPNLPGPAPVVFGGQILAQAVVAASIEAPGKELKSLHTVFARGASPEQPLEILVEPIQEGRTLTTLSISFVQGGKIGARCTALLHTPEPDLIRHGAPMPSVTAPADTKPRGASHSWWEVRVVDDVDLLDPAAVGPAELFVWSRFSDLPETPMAQQALLAFASDGFLIATAMRPHEGVGQSMAHVSISTSVVAQTIDFHEPFRASEWLLLAHSSPYAGRGRSYGRADVFTEAGRLVASYAQENIVRNFPEGQQPAPGTRAKA
jgi:acyl-CoA thioesterase-2